MKQGWESKKLGEVAKIGAGNSAPQDKSLFTNGVYPFFRTSDIGKIRIGGVSTAVDLLNDQGIKKLKLYPKGTILLPKSGASTFLNHRVILDVNGFVSSHLATVVCDEDLLDKRFALYYLIGIKAQDLIQDHSYPSLKLSDIKEIPIPIPSLEEQKQIVAKLDQCFEAIDKAKANAAKNLENAKELFQSKLNEIFSQKGEGWVEKKLGAACLITMGQSPKGTSYNQEGEGVPLINGPVEFGKDSFDKTIKSKFTTEPTKMCRQGDLILCVRGSTTGKINIAGFDACIGRGVASIRFDQNQRWLDYFIRSKRNEIYSLGTGSTFPNVSRTILSKLPFLIPPVEQQNRLVETMNKLLSSTNLLQVKYQQELNSLEELKKSILQKAFEGEL